MKNNKFTVKYGNFDGGYFRHWNCGDSLYEALRVYEYMKYLYKIVCIYRYDQKVQEFISYDEGSEETQYKYEES